MTHPGSVLSPEVWLRDLFSSKSVTSGQVIRRKTRDIERYAGMDLFLSEARARGFQVIQNREQLVIFCNPGSCPPSPLTHVFRHGKTTRNLAKISGLTPAFRETPFSSKENGTKSASDFVPRCTRRKTPYIRDVPSGTMDINALVINGSDPGAVPGDSTNHPSFGDHGVETGSTDV